ncbi:hypothetical protein TNCV_1570351 [Trichonephila clavipes]|uniref:Uncharacterized protein n=1 Tax=Trichonephila clavipes TaxID=2585209 RepID=A0A8X6SPI6_TRICX|nr:hypothetical protein TNCV_1570351 [Trichonephila clavipes]
MCAVNSPVSPGGCSCLPSASQTCSIGERSGDLEGHEIAPHTVTPCEIAVCRSTINVGSDRWPVRLQTCERWSSALRLNRDSSLKMTRLQSVTLQIARGRQNPVDTAYDVGSVVSVLADVGSSSQLRSVVSYGFS